MLRTLPRMMVTGWLVMASLASAANAQTPVINEDFTLFGSDAADNGEYGFSTSLSGVVTIIGALRNNALGAESGAAYVYRFDGSSWIEEQKLIPSDGGAGDRFGWSVATNGNVAVVGANSADHDGGVSAGAAYIFRFDGTQWLEEAKLTASDASTLDTFGHSVAIFNNVVVIGADHDDPLGSSSGSVYVFRFDGATWVEEVKLTASDGLPGDFFGGSVSIHGDRIAVGASGVNVDGVDTGAVYLFRDDGVSWIEETKIIASDAPGLKAFGGDVDLEGEMLAVGAFNDDERAVNAGAAYVYRFDGVLWNEEAKLTSSDALWGDRFGISVSIDGNSIVVGAWASSHSGLFDPGSAYVYRFDGFSWSEVFKLIASDAAADDNLGWSVSMDGGVAVVSARQISQTAPGKAYVFGIPEPDLSPVAWWRMDEAASGPVFDGQIQDYGSGPNSTNIGGNPGDSLFWFTDGVPSDASCVDGRAIHFNAGPDQLSFGQGENDELRITGAITVWARAMVGGGSSLLGKGTGGLSPTLGYRLIPIQPAIPNNYVVWEVSETGSSFELSLASQPGSITNDEWMDLAAIFMPSSFAGANDGFAAIYRDGIAIASTTHDLTGIFDNPTRAFHIGGSLGADVDQVRVYNRALSDAEILALSDLGDIGPDCNVNGISDECEIADGFAFDCNANMIPDECDIASGLELDCNGNFIPDACDLADFTELDCNTNGIPDSCDIASGSSGDCNANGVPDECPGDVPPDDCNANGIPDVCDLATGGSRDLNSNGIPDECEPDCNCNNRPDDLDIAQGFSLDTNGDGVPDECGFPDFPPGDVLMRFSADQGVTLTEDQLFLAQWADLSGNPVGLTFIGSPAPRYIADGFVSCSGATSGVLRFEGSQAMILDLGSIGLTDATIFTVVRFSQPLSKSREYIYAIGDNEVVVIAGGILSLGRGMESGAASDISVHHNGGSTIMLGAPLSGTEWHVTSQVYRGGFGGTESPSRHQLWIDGIDADMPKATFPYHATETVVLGAMPSTGQTLVGDVREFVIFDRVLTEQERQAVEAFLRGPQPSAIPGDVNGDGIINVTDLLALLGSWGSCPSPCPADTDNDGTVNVTDLLTLLGNWG